MLKEETDLVAALLPLLLVGQHTDDKCVTETRLVVLRARSRHGKRVAVCPHVLGFPAYLQLALHRKPFKGNITSCQKTANTTSAATTFS